MTPNEYQKECQRNQPSFEQDLLIEKRMSRNAMLLHALLGLCSEIGEFADAIKKHVIYNQPLDITNLKEELGDKCWYLALACTALDINLEDVMQHNIDKLRIRYPEKFTEEHASLRLDKAQPPYYKDCGCKVGVEACDICHPPEIDNSKEPLDNFFGPIEGI